MKGAHRRPQHTQFHKPIKAAPQSGSLDSADVFPVWKNIRGKLCLMINDLTRVGRQTCNGYALLGR